MQFIPNYTVSYKGTFHRAGIPFDVALKDREMMEMHGRFEEEKDVDQRRPGRPKKEDVVEK